MLDAATEHLRRRRREHERGGQCTIDLHLDDGGQGDRRMRRRRCRSAARRAFTVQTDGQAPNSGDAVKTFVDANIQITPNGDEPGRSRRTRSRRT